MECVDLGLQLVRSDVGTSQDRGRLWLPLKSEVTVPLSRLRPKRCSVACCPKMRLPFAVVT